MCLLFGHKMYSGYWLNYRWEKCSRCKKLGEPITGKPKWRK
ncbi:hypothetical protein [Cytobacillus horneckiae]